MKQIAMKVLTLTVGALWAIGFVYGVTEWFVTLPNNPLYGWITRLY